LRKCFESIIARQANTDTTQITRRRDTIPRDFIRYILYTYDVSEGVRQHEEWGQGGLAEVSRAVRRLRALVYHIAVIRFPRVGGSHCRERIELHL